MLKLVIVFTFLAVAVCKEENRKITEARLEPEDPTGYPYTRVGYVQVKTKSLTKWTYICKKGFNLKMADLVCKYKGSGLDAIIGKPPREKNITKFTDMICSNTTVEIKECMTVASKTQCEDKEFAYVACLRENETTKTPTPPTNPPSTKPPTTKPPITSTTPESSPSCGSLSKPAEDALISILALLLVAILGFLAYRRFIHKN